MVCRHQQATPVSGSEGTGRCQGRYVQAAIFSKDSTAKFSRADSCYFFDPLRVISFSPAPALLPSPPGASLCAGHTATTAHLILFCWKPTRSGYGTLLRLALLLAVSTENLKILSLGRNNLKSLAGLEQVAETLGQLWISYCLIEKLKGVSVLKKVKVLI